MNGNFLLVIFQQTYFSEHGRIECPSISRGIRNNNVMVFINADNSSSLSQTLVHSIRPSPVTMLQMLNYFQLKVNIHLISVLELQDPVAADQSVSYDRGMPDWRLIGPQLLCFADGFCTSSDGGTSASAAILRRR